MRKYLEINEHKTETKSRNMEFPINQPVFPVQKIKLLPNHDSLTNAKKIINFVLANKGKLLIFSLENLIEFLTKLY